MPRTQWQLFGSGVDAIKIPRIDQLQANGVEVCGVAGGQLPVMGQSRRCDYGVGGADRPAQAFSMAHQGSEPLRCRAVERQHRLLGHLAQKHVPALLQLLLPLGVGQSRDALQDLGFVLGGDGVALRPDRSPQLMPWDMPVR